MLVRCLLFPNALLDWPSTSETCSCLTSFLIGEHTEAEVTQAVSCTAASVPHAAAVAGKITATTVEEHKDYHEDT